MSIETLVYKAVGKTTQTDFTHVYIVSSSTIIHSGVITSRSVHASIDKDKVGS